MLLWGPPHVREREDDQGARVAAAAHLRRTLGYGWESRLDNHTSTVW
jgi:hypothetical protein